MLIFDFDIQKVSMEKNEVIIKNLFWRNLHGFQRKDCLEVAHRIPLLPEKPEVASVECHRTPSLSPMPYAGFSCKEFLQIIYVEKCFYDNHDFVI